MTTEEIRKAVKVLGAERAARALQAFPRPRRRAGESSLWLIGWRDCPVAYVYGAPDRLREAILRDRQHQSVEVFVAQLVQLPQWVVSCIVDAYDDPHDRPILKRVLQEATRA